ncbi:hypothetical protein D6D25_01888, partial [Aureobasidium pullulans]
MASLTHQYTYPIRPMPVRPNHVRTSSKEFQWTSAYDHVFNQYIEPQGTCNPAALAYPDGAIANEPSPIVSSVYPEPTNQHNRLWSANSFDAKDIHQPSPTFSPWMGNGTADDSFNYLNQDPSHTPPYTPTVAPKKASLKRFTQPLNLRLPAQGTFSKLHHAWSRAVNSRIGRAENTRFLEHFRYLIVASQLLNEYPDLGSLHTTQINGTPFDSTESGPNASLNISGVAATAGVAFVLVLVLNWLRGSRLSKSRVLLALACAAVAA